MKKENLIWDLIVHTASSSIAPELRSTPFEWLKNIWRTDAKSLLLHMIDDAEITISNPNKLVYQIMMQKKRTVMINELNRLSSLLNTHNIPFLVLKGIPMEYVIYQRKMDRDSGDIDLLIPPHSMESVLSLLVEDGYQFLDNVHGYKKTTMEQALLLETRHIVMIKNQILVEVHYQFHFYKGDHSIGNFPKLLKNWELYYPNHIIIDNDEIKQIPTLDTIDAMLLVSNHILFELQEYRLRQKHNYPLKLFIDAFFLAIQIGEQRLGQCLLQRSVAHNYHFCIQMALIHIHQLFDWYDSEIWKLFDLDQIYTYRNTINYDNCCFLPIGEWNKSLKERFFNYSLDDMMFYIS